MLKTRSSHLPLRIAGLAAGLVLAASFLFVLRIQPSNGRLGADMRLVTLVPGELTAAPDGFFLSARGLQPGEAPRTGRVRLRNIAPRPVDVRARALPSDRELAEVAHMELRSGGRVLARGSVAALRGSSEPLRIPRQGVRTLEARVWIPRSTRRGYEARFADVTVELRAEVVRSRR